jgi:YVTN family beta-propeller protein
MVRAPWNSKVCLCSLVVLSGLVTESLKLGGQTPEAYVMTAGTNSVSVIGTNDQLLSSFPVNGGLPASAALSPNGSRLYVACAGSGSVLVIDTASHNLIQSIPVNSAPAVLALTPDGNRLYVVGDPPLIGVQTAGVVAEIDTNSFAVSYVSGIGSSPFGIASSVDGSTVYVVNQSPAHLYAINTSTNQITDSVDLSSQMGYALNVAVKPDGSTIYVTGGNGSGTQFGMNAYSVTSLGSPGPFGPAVSGSAQFAAAPTYAAISPDGSTLAVTLSNNSLAIINTGTDAVVSYVSTGNNPIWVDFSADGKRAYVTNKNSGTVSIYDTTNNYAQLSPIVLSGTPLGVVARPPSGQSSGGGSGSPKYLIYATPSFSPSQTLIDTSLDQVAGSLFLNPGYYPESGGVASPDGSRVYVPANYSSGQTSFNTIQAIDTGTQNLVVSFGVGSGSFTDMDISPDGTQLCFASGGAVYFINTSNGSVSNLNFSQPQQNPTSFSQVAYSSDGSRVYALGNNSLNVSVIDTVSETIIATFPTALSPVLVGPTVDGSGIIVVSSSGSVQDYDAVTFNPIGPPVSSGSCSTPVSGAFAPDGSRYYLGCGNEIDLISLTNGNAGLMGVLPSYGQNPAVTPDGRKVYAYSSNSNSIVDLTVTSNALMPNVSIANTSNIQGEMVIADPRSHLTATGNNVTVNLNVPGGTISVNFVSVSSSGTTVATRIPPSAAGTVPSGYAVGPFAFDITSTASYSAPLTICFTLPTITDPTTFANTRVLHNEGGTLVDRTILSGPNAPNFATRMICAQTYSLSPFAIALLAASTNLQISAPSTTTYGSNPSVTVDVTSSSTVNGNVSLSVNGGAPTAQPLSGGFATFTLPPLMPGTYTLSANFAGQGSFSGSSGTTSLTVSPAPLTITAQSASSTYGMTPGPYSVGTYSGFVGTDGPGSLTGTLSCTSGATSSSPAGNYSITCGGVSSPNYTITSNPGTLNVKSAPLTITANNAAVVLHGAIPTLTASYSGFVLSQNASVLAGTLTCTTTATSASPVGSYPITCSGLTSINYAISYVAGTLKIQFATAGACDGAPGHQILPPIDPAGFSVYNQGRTIPAQFRVCDANVASIGTAGVVVSFYLTRIISGTTSTSVQNVVDTNNPDTAFRWDPTAQEWIFNMSTQNLAAGATYVYTISLLDGSTIGFQFGLR